VSNVGYATLSIIPSTKGFGSALGKDVNGPMAGIGDSGGKLLGGGLVAAAAKFAAPLAAAFGIGKIFRTGFEEAADAAKLNAQLAAGIASTGNAANVTVDGLNKYAGALQLATGQTDDSIAGAQSLLLTFTNIKNVGPDKIFDQATLAAANMAARLGGDAASQATVLGKALNDPILGVTALTRKGVQFTDAQKEQISTLVESGNTLEAQKIILAELETQFGGSAEAAGKTFPGQIEILKRSFEDFSQMLVGRFGPGLATGLGFLSSGIQAATPVVDAFLTSFGQKFIAARDLVVGVFSGGLGGAVQAAAAGIDLGPVAGPLTALATTARTVFDFIVAAVAPVVPQIVALGPAFAGVGATFLALLPQVGTLISSLSPLGLVVAAAGPQIAELAVAVGTLLGAALTAVLPAVTQLSTTLVSALTPVLGALLPILTQFASFLTDNIGPLTALGAVVLGGVAAFQAYAGILAIIRTATVAYAVVQGVLNAVMSANPIGIIIVAVGALVAGIVYLATQTTFFQDLWANVVAFMEPLLAGLGSFFTDVFNGIGQVVTTVVGGVVSFVQGYFSTLQSIFTGLGSFVTGLWTNLWTGLGSFLSGALQNYVRFVSDGIGNVVGFFRDLPGKILGFLGGLGDLLVGTGRNLIEGLIKGVQQVAGNIAETVLKPIRDAVNGVKSFLGIRSPSRLFMQIGAYTGEGMAIGLERSASLVARASEALIPTAPTVRAPEITAGGVVGALTTISAGADRDRPITMDGALVGILRETARGEAQLLLDMEASRLRAGYRRP